MSKKRNYRAPSNNGGWKLLSVVQLLVSIALAIVIVCAVGSEGFTKKDVKTWFKKDQEQQKPDDGEDGELDVTPGEAYGIMLLEGDLEVEKADNVRTLTARVLDETTGEALDELQTVEFSMDWQGGAYTPDMTTSTDINDYVTMEVNGMTATFTCLTGFETPITVTCRSTRNTDKYATAQLDYLKPLFFGVSFDSFGTPGSVKNGDVYEHKITVPYATSYSELNSDKIYKLFTGIDSHVIGTKSYWSDYAVWHCPALSVNFTPEFQAYAKEQMGSSNANFYMPYLSSDANRAQSAFTVSLKEMLNASSRITSNYGNFMQLFNSFDGPEIVVSFGTLKNYNSKNEEITIDCKYYIDLAILVTVGDVVLDNPSIDFND